MKLRSWSLLTYTANHLKELDILVGECVGRFKDIEEIDNPLQQASEHIRQAIMLIEQADSV